MILNLDDDKNILFDGDDEIFKKHVIESKFYFEYGVGKSTKWVLENTKSSIIAVDSDKKWIDRVCNKNSLNERIQTIWVDLGDLTDWGRPVSYNMRDNFITYINAVWGFKKRADIILIDGRFRVACFLYSLLNAKKGSLIFFDDYNNRPWYHIVEEVLPIYKKCGRQGVFRVTETFNKRLARDLFQKFLFVFD